MRHRSRPRRSAETTASRCRTSSSVRLRSPRRWTALRARSSRSTPVSAHRGRTGSAGRRALVHRATRAASPSPNATSRSSSLSGVPVAGVTSTLTSLIGDHGVYAVFLLMIVAAVLPAASELTMLYAGAVASGAFADAHVVLFGSRLHSHAAAYVVIAVAGLLGNLVGAVGGWLIGTYAEPWLERRGRLLHVTPERLRRARRWFDRFGGVAVPVGFMTPGVRSFVAIPAGIGRMPLGRFLVYAFVGCAVFCFGLAV